MDRARMPADMGRIIDVVRTFIPSERWPDVQAALRGETTVYAQHRSRLKGPGGRSHASSPHRATMASLAGASAAETMRRLGHSSYRAAVRYQGLADGRDTTISENLSKLWKESSSG